MMIEHAKAVVNNTKKALIVVDMPLDHTKKIRK